MDKRAEIGFGKIQNYDPEKRLYRVSMDDGRILHNCRKVGDITSNTGGRKVGELENDVQVLMVLKWDDDYGVDAPEGYILGSVETYGAGQLGTTVEKKTQPAGSQGFIDKHDRRILLHPDGVIEVRSGAWCQFAMDPEDNSITGFFQNVKMTKDRSNFFKWIIHPESEDLKDALMHLCVSGFDSLSKETPDIELLAGALSELQNDQYFHTDQFTIDPGAKVAIRITNPDVEQQTDFFQQIGAMADGAVAHTKIVHAGGVELEFKSGDINTGEMFSMGAKREDGANALIQIGNMENGLTGLIRVNNIDIRTFEDGRFQVINDKMEIEGTNEGKLNLVCVESNLGDKGAGKHIALAEDVVGLLEDLIDAILQSTYMVASPGAPTAPPGPINMPIFRTIKAKLDTIKSTVHTINK